MDEGNFCLEPQDLPNPFTFTLFFRAHVSLHQHSCPMKASECRVPGCKTMTPRKDIRTHLYEAAKSHYDLQHGERQRLLALIKAEVRSQIDI